MLSRPFVFACAAILFQGICQIPAHAAEKATTTAAPVVILKLDDITRGGARANEPISPRWQRCVDFIEREHLRASLGLIPTNGTTRGSLGSSQLSGISKSRGARF